MSSASRIRASAPIEEIEPSVGTYNRLRRASIHTVAQLASSTPDELRQCGLDERRLDEVRVLLRNHGRFLANDDES